MSDEQALPEGVGLADVRTHAVNVSIAGTLINLSGKHLTAPEGTAAEAEAESELDEFMERIVSLGPDTAAGVLLVFASLIAQTGDEAEVQRWFDEQGKHIAAALAEGERGA